LSFANKTPECMASGTPILAFGPEEVPTISYLKEHDLALVVDRNDAADLDDAIIEMVVNAGRRASMAMSARHRVFEHHNSHNVRSQVKMIMEHASKSREETADRR